MNKIHICDCAQIFYPLEAYFTYFVFLGFPKQYAFELAINRLAINRLTKNKKYIKIEPKISSNGTIEGE